MRPDLLVHDPLCGEELGSARLQPLRFLRRSVQKLLVAARPPVGATHCQARRFHISSRFTILPSMGPVLVRTEKRGCSPREDGRQEWLTRFEHTDELAKQIVCGEGPPFCVVERHTASMNQGTVMCEIAENFCFEMLNAGKSKMLSASLCKAAFQLLF